MSATGTRVSIAQLTPAGVGKVTSTPVPAGAFAANWIGRRVVIGQAYGSGCCGYDKTRYDIWDSTAGLFAPQWTAEVFPVYGPVPDGAPAFGMWRSSTNGGGCLAQLDGVRSLASTGKACLPGQSRASLEGVLAPDGRHLVEKSVVGGTEQLVLLELPGAVSTVTPVHSYQAIEVVAWEDNSTFLAVNVKHLLVRCGIDGSQTVVSGGAADAWFVPRFGV